MYRRPCLRLLIFAEQAAKAEVVIATLGAAGYELTWEVVIDLSESRPSQPHDILIANTDQLKPLMRWRRLLGLERVPLIVYLEDVSTAQALGLLHQGAWDVVDQPHNLIVAIERELHRLEQTQHLTIAHQRCQLANFIADVGIWDWHLPTDEFYIDPIIKAGLGYEDIEIANTRSGWEQLIHPGDRLLFQNRLQRCLDGSAPEFELEYRHVHKNGSVYWYNCKAASYAEDRIIGVAIDISRRKQVELELQKSTMRAWDLYQNAPCGYHTLDINGIFTDVNTTELNWLGYTWEELIHRRGFSELLTPASQVMFCQHLDILKTTGEISNVEYEVIRKDGMRLHVSLNAKVVRGEDAQVTGYRCTLFDVSDRHQAVAQLHAANQRWHSLLENVQLAVIGLDPAGLVKYINPWLLKILGYSQDQVIGKKWLGKFVTTQMVNQNPLDWPACQQLVITTCAGQERVISWNNTILRSPKGDPLGIISIGEDITERLAVEQMKNEFISVVSHELRTPLTAIRGAIGMAASGLLDQAKKQRMLEIALANTDRLSRLINDILDVERIESGKVQMQKQPCQAVPLTQGAIDEIQPLADKAQITLEFLPPPEQVTRLTFLADHDRLIQVITNLLSNAIKFSLPKSTVVIEISLVYQPEEDSDWSVCWQIRDQGRGIPADKLENIFGRFQQVDASDSRIKGGTGLGLAICNSIIQQHGGRIWVESELGVGSSFYFTLPITGELLPPPEPVSSVPRQLVLVCDDDPDQRLEIKGFLKNQGYDVILAASGLEAIAQAEARQPHLIILDLLMPGQDGLETLAILQKNPATREIPVLIFSVLTPEQELPLGVKGWLTKSTPLRSLASKIEQILSEANPRVLVIEDDPDLAQVMVQIFVEQGFAVSHARTGWEAINIARQTSPHLLLLDVILPEGDGFAVVEWLRHSANYKGIPILVYSALDLQPQEQEQIRLGPTEFLVKGKNTPEQVKERVLDLLNRLSTTKPQTNTGPSAGIPDS